MTPTRPRPAVREAETQFALEELFFSRTDAKGILRSGNDVFVRISGYAREELLGQSHNIVRHPVMPRAAFRVLWEHLQAGRPVVAYVCNLSKDGSRYWVLASVVPVPGGFLSIRLKPTSALFEIVKGIYADVLAHEQRAEAGDPRVRKRAIEAGVQRLTELLAAQGFADYATFMRVAFAEQVLARSRALAADGRGGEPSREADGGHLTAIVSASQTTERLLTGLVGRLDDYAHVGEDFAAKSRFLLELAGDVRLGSLNAILAAAHMTDNAAALGAVAGIMRGRAEVSAPLIEALSAGIDHTVAVLAQMRFDVCLAQLQTEMLTVFADGLTPATGACAPSCASWRRWRSTRAWKPPTRTAPTASSPCSTTSAGRSRPPRTTSRASTGCPRCQRRPLKRRTRRRGMPTTSHGSSRR